MLYVESNNVYGQLHGGLRKRGAVRESEYSTHFGFPAAPDMVFPETAQTWAEVVIWSVAIAFFFYALVELRRTRSPLALVLMAGGAIALLNEPIDDVLGLVHHPRPNQNVVLDTIGPVPMWGLPTYIIFFGALPYVFLKELRRLRFTVRGFWIGIGITFVLDLLIEIPLLQADLYRYYSFGDTPLEIAHFPLYWLFINTTGPILCAAILFQAPQYFSGWRAPFLVLLPVVTDSACSVAVGLPVYNAIHAPEGSDLWRWGGAIASCVIGMMILDGLSRWMAARTRQLREREPPKPAVTQPAAPERALGHA